MESFLVALLIGVIVLGLIYWALTLLPIPQPFKNVALVILILIAVIWLVTFLPGAPFRLR